MANNCVVKVWGAEGSGRLTEVAKKKNQKGGPNLLHQQLRNITLVLRQELHFVSEEQRGYKIGEVVYSRLGIKKDRMEEGERGFEA